MLRHLIKKEFLQLRRDRRMLPIVIIAPILQLFIFGYAASVDVKNINTVVCDYDKTPESRNYLSGYFNNSYFTKIGEINDYQGIDRYLDMGLADVGLIIPFGFGKAIASGESATVQGIFNGSDSNAGGVGLNYASQINARYASAVMLERIAKMGNVKIPLVNLEDRIWYNPELRSRNFMVPGVLSMILMVMTMMLTALAIVREKERGTIEQLIVTPVKSYQIILGKLIPFILVGFLDMAIALAITIFGFGVPLKGTVLALFVSSIFFLLNTLGIGIFISTVSKTQHQAIMTVVFFFMMPFIYLSGFIFPIENMPIGMQYITYLIPLRYFLTIIRGIFLKGVGPDILWQDGLSLVILGCFILILSITRFRKQV